MPGERLSMRKIREVLRLRLGQGLPQRAAAQSLRLSQGAVHSYMARARRAGLGWPLPDGIDDIQLEALLFPPPSSVEEQRPMPDWAVVHRELRRPNVTLPGDRLARLPGAKISLQEKPVIRRELESPRNKTGVFSTWKRHCGRSLPALGMVRIAPERAGTALMHKAGRSPHSRRSGGSILRLLAIASYFAASSSSALEMSSSVTREAMRL